MKDRCLASLLLLVALCLSPALAAEPPPCDVGPTFVASEIASPDLTTALGIESLVAEPTDFVYAWSPVLTSTNAPRHAFEEQAEAATAASRSVSPAARDVQGANAAPEPAAAPAPDHPPESPGLA